MIFDQPAAEEILQEVFFSIWKGAGRYRGHASVKTWIYRIAHNQTVSWLRRNRRDVGLAAIEMTPSEHDPEQIFMTSSSHQALKDAVNMLSSDQKEVLELVIQRVVATFRKYFVREDRELFKAISVDESQAEKLREEIDGGSVP
jgi:RNA polymerase sigma-70 factor (ECF subfamily)